VLLPRYVVVTSWSTKPYRIRPCDEARPKACPRAGAKSAYTSMEVSPDGWSQSSDASPVTSSAASSASLPASAAASAARTTPSTWSREAALADTDPVAVPDPVAWKATTVTVTECITPLVVSVLLAQRRFALVESCTITTHWSDVEVTNACSTRSCGVAAVMMAVHSLVVTARSLQ
jgi:hypothetical protein